MLQVACEEKMCDSFLLFHQSILANASHPSNRTDFFYFPRLFIRARPCTTTTTSATLSFVRTSDDESGGGIVAPTALSNIAHVGFVRLVVAGGDMCGLMAHEKGVSAAIAMLLRELASSEIVFVNALRDALRSWLLPFSKVRVHSPTPTALPTTQRCLWSSSPRASV